MWSIRHCACACLAFTLAATAEGADDGAAAAGEEGDSATGQRDPFAAPPALVEHASTTSATLGQQLDDIRYLGMAENAAGERWALVAREEDQRWRLLREGEALARGSGSRVSVIAPRRLVIELPDGERVEVAR